MRSTRFQVDYTLPRRADFNKIFSLALDSFEQGDPVVYSAILVSAYALIERTIAVSIRACEHLRRVGLLNRYSRSGVVVCHRQALGKLNLNSSSPPVQELANNFLAELQSSTTPVGYLHQGATYGVLVDFLEEIDPELALRLRLKKALFDGMRVQRNEVGHGSDIRAFWDPKEPRYANEAKEFANLVLAAGVLVMEFFE